MITGASATGMISGALNPRSCPAAMTSVDSRMTAAEAVASIFSGKDGIVELRAR